MVFTELITKIVSSLAKVFPDEISENPINRITAFKNEPFSFQVAYKNSELLKEATQIYTRVESEIPQDFISEYNVENVPIINAALRGIDEYFEKKETGIYPDILLKRTLNAKVLTDVSRDDRVIEYNQEQMLCSVPVFRSLWFSVNEKGKTLNPGNYTFTVSFFTRYGENLIGKEKIEIEILPEELPQQEVTYTNWFHLDCLADIYGVEVFSEKHFDIIRSFLSLAAENGMNMVLLPVFTPPLDTPVNEERKTVQLVGVSVKESEYTFDFSLMERFINLCRECGINKFEHSHLFTQWGAKSAPKIIADIDGEKKRIFGWDTDAAGNEYKKFLKSYFNELKKFLKYMNIGKDDIIFHISDEPSDEHIDYYKNAYGIISENLGEYNWGDALDRFEYYQNGCVKTPIVLTASEEIDQFVNNCDNYWVYYTGNQLNGGFSNRLITTTSARNRILGTQMYVGGAKGFLHWGYNYYYDVLSEGLFNPLCSPGGYLQHPGTSYIVYPKADGSAIPSIRLKVFYEGFNDHRALRMFEKYAGKEKVNEFINQNLGKVNYHFCPSNEIMFEFRQKLNNEIKKYL